MQDVGEWEQASLAKSLTTPREQGSDNNADPETPTGASAHVRIHSEMDEGEERVNKEEREDRHEAIRRTETDDQHVAAGVCGCAYSNGSPICRFV